MIQHEKDIEMEAVMHTAYQMCAAARTAPKTKGIDHLKTCVISAGVQETLAKEMDRLADEWGMAFFHRDANCVRRSQAVVLIGTVAGRRGLGVHCGDCGFAGCSDCAEHGGACAYDSIDLGIALGSAVSVAADNRVDSRVMFSVGKAAVSLGLLGEDCKMVLGLPLSVSGKSPYFDR